MKDFEDLLLESCAEMNFRAGDKCKKDYVDKDNGCEWYHSVWQYLRVLNCVSAPQWHKDFYIRAFDAALNNKKKARILISGTADYSLLHLIFCVLARSEIKADIDVLDMCATPLSSCRWYFYNCKEVFGEKIGESLMQSINLQKVQKDLLYHNVDDYSKYDLICSDAFLTRFEKQDVDSVVRKWRDLLFDDGHIVTTVRLHEEHIPPTLISVTRGVDTFIKKVKDRYKHFVAQGKKLNKKTSKDSEQEISEEELLYLSYRYIVRMVSHDIGDKNDIKRLIEGNGLIIQDDLSETAVVEGEISASEYYRITAVKNA